ncbi:MAG: GspH/FimT family pseudopilin [Gammaproteobacteria bacterium]|nr:GspH/FimT family pseudopilin [Gammaproteobacteria bacterium]
MGKMHAEGVTLIELMVVLAVLATVLSVGIPAFNQFTAANRMTASVNDVMAALQLARSEAIKRRGTVTVCASANPEAVIPACAASGGLTQGWIVFTDLNSNAAVDPGEPILASGAAAPADIAANSSFANGGAGNPCYAAFGDDGRLANLAAPPSANLTDLQFCDHRGNVDTGGGIAAGRWIRLSPNGRPQLVRERARIQGVDNPLGGC